MIRYRKTRKGEWVAFGPSNEIRIGEVTIVTAQGKRKSEKIISLGRTFQHDGVRCAYGYLASERYQSVSSSRIPLSRNSQAPLSRTHCPSKPSLIECFLRL